MERNRTNQYFSHHSSVNFCNMEKYEELHETVLKFWNASIVVLILTSSTGFCQYDNNIHNCGLKKNIMTSFWRGQGLYSTDRAMPGVQTLLFDRSMDGRLTITTDVAPDLMNINFIHGTASCRDVQAPAHVVVTILLSTLFYLSKIEKVPRDIRRA